MPECITTDEYHVASFVAHAMVDKLEQVKNEVLLLEGAEIHAINDVGKIVFTIEANSHKSIGRLIDSIRHHSGLLSISPVYHQFLAEEQTTQKEGQL